MSHPTSLQHLSQPHSPPGLPGYPAVNARWLQLRPGKRGVRTILAALALTAFFTLLVAHYVAAYAHVFGCERQRQVLTRTLREVRSQNLHLRLQLDCLRDHERTVRLAQVNQMILANPATDVVFLAAAEPSPDAQGRVPSWVGRQQETLRQALLPAQPTTLVATRPQRPPMVARIWPTIR